MSDLDVVAKRVASHAAAKNNEYGIDPVTISIIISIVTNLIKLWWTCKSQSKIRSELQNPSWLFRLFLKREIRKQVGRKNKEALFGAFLDVAPTLSEKEITNILKQVGEKK